LIRVGDMNYKYMAMFLAATLPGLVFGQGPQTYQCSYGDLQRRVEILHETGATVPCEVHYYKDSEAPGDRQVLWRAVSELGYCERKTEEFIAKLQNLGWNCGQDGDLARSVEQGLEAPPEDVDDTELLTPAVETELSEETESSEEQ